MYTKPLTRRSIATLDHSNDWSAIRRLLMAAAINPRFCARLLEEPRLTVQNGYGGEQFQLSESLLNILDSIHTLTLPDFIQQLDDHLSNRLLVTVFGEADR